MRESQRTWTAKNRDRVNAQSRAWAARNPEKVKAISKAKYLRRKAEHLALVRRRKLRLRRAICDCCAPISFKFMYLQAQSLKMEVDHVQPISKGGKHCLHNLQLLERSANRAKAAKWAA